MSYSSSFAIHIASGLVFAWYGSFCLQYTIKNSIKPPFCILRYKLDVVSAGKNFTKIRKAIAAGFFFHAARKDPQEGYRTLVENQPVYIHPSSALFQRQPDWVIYHELVMTTKEYMREVTVVDPKWLVELAPRFFKVADPTKLSKRKRQERIEPLYDRYHEPNSWRLSKRRG
jgi:ATP-dependent RNA helicase DHX8/PRP22